MKSNLSKKKEKSKILNKKINKYNTTNIKKTLLNDKISNTTSSNDTSSSSNNISRKNKIHKKYTLKKYFRKVTSNNFNNLINNHYLFSKYKFPNYKNIFNYLYKSFISNKDYKDSEIKDIYDLKNKFNDIFFLSPSQKFLRNFMSPQTPYRGLFIIHGTGVGKTCTAISIAENLKQYVNDNSRKIYVIRPDEFKRQIFDFNLLSSDNISNQCTGSSYILPEYEDNIELCKQGSKENCAFVEKSIKKDIKRYYEFTNSLSWANKIQDIINKRTSKLTGKDKIDRTKKEIQQMFNNSVLIIDEAHDLRSGSNIKEEKIVPPILKLVLKYSKNLRLILLSATPMFDKSQNIISLLNYLLLNDKRPLLKENEIFNSIGELKQDGKHKLLKSCSGYISYLRGNNPFEFPIRLDSSYLYPKDIISHNYYPNIDLFGNTINSNIKYLPIIDCKMKKYQKEIFDIYFNYIKKSSSSSSSSSTSSSSSSLSSSTNSSSSTRSGSDSSSSSKSKFSSVSSNSLDSSSSSKKSSSSSSKSKDDIKLLYNIDSSVAYSNELQMSNFIYQSLEEGNDNIKNCYGSRGLKAVSTKYGNKNTYKFNDEEYGKRFFLPELENWSSKFAKLLSYLNNNDNPIFIYSYFTPSGVLPLAFMLEMNGYKRYKMHSNPLLENKYKKHKYRGDYIIYTGNEKLSAYARYYFDKRKNMINESNVKIVIGSRKASEGLNLFGFREVHIMDPWHNLNLIEQSIGRIIRKGSHLHLPPRERNVTVYLYGATLDDKESIDLKIYKISEDKIIKSGIVEDILRTNAIDCYLNKNVNYLDPNIFNKKIPINTSNGSQIKINLSDIPFSKGCLYMDKCNYKCSGDSIKKTKTKPNKKSNLLLYNNYEKDINEYINIILSLLLGKLNIDIKYLVKYLNIKSELELKLLYSAIEILINKENIYTNKNNVKGTININNNIIRFIPMNTNKPNISFINQYDKNKNIVNDINLKNLILNIKKDSNEIKLTDEDSYSKIFNNLIKKCNNIINNKNKDYNFKYDDKSIISLLFNKLVFSSKFIIIKNIIKKHILAKELNDNEKVILSILNDKYIIKYKDIYIGSSNNTIYGFIIIKLNKLQLYKYDYNKNIYELNNNLIKNIIEKKKKNINLTNHNKIYGFIIYDKINQDAIFKITDLALKGDKKSVKGARCSNNNINDINKYLSILLPNYNKNEKIKKNNLCNYLEYLFLKYDIKKKMNKKWYFTPEEYYIKFNI